MLEKREEKKKRDLAEREAVAARVPVSALTRR